MKLIVKTPLQSWGKWLIQFHTFLHKNGHECPFSVLRHLLKRFFFPSPACSLFSFLSNLPVHLLGKEECQSELGMLNSCWGEKIYFPLSCLSRCHGSVLVLPRWGHGGTYTVFPAGDSSNEKPSAQHFQCSIWYWPPRRRGNSQGFFFFCKTSIHPCHAITGEFNCDYLWDQFWAPQCPFPPFLKRIISH